MNAFKAYDVRGVYGKDFEREDVYKIGYFLPEIFETNTIAVGRDVRLSSPEIFEALCEGITDGGANVHDLGLCTTPYVYWTTAEYRYDLSVMITASHNPKQYNGLKISRKNAMPVGFENGLDKLQETITTRQIFVKEEKGKIFSIDYKKEYLSFQRQWKTDLSNLKMVIDCSNGMASLFIKELMKEENPAYLLDTLDGNFPVHEPNPLEPENIKLLQDTVIQNKADVGIIFDGDADRVMFVDEKGNFISPDLLIAVLGKYFLTEKNLKGKVLQDIRTSKSVSEAICEMGGEIEMWKVGRAYAALKLREIDGIFGGELAGHYYFRDFYYSDSAIMACLILLHIFSEAKERSNQTVSEIIRQIQTYFNSGELNFIIEQKDKAMETAKNYFLQKEKSLALYDFDGYRIEFEDWWFNIRPSNTEPYLRLIAEAKTKDILDEKLGVIKSLLLPFLVES